MVSLTEAVGTVPDFSSIVFCLPGAADVQLTHAKLFLIYAR